MAVKGEGWGEDKMKVFEKKYSKKREGEKDGTESFVVTFRLF